MSELELNIDRYTCDPSQGGTCHSDKGEYVLHEDYEHLRQQLEAAQGILAEAEKNGLQNYAANVLLERCKRVEAENERLQSIIKKAQEQEPYAFAITGHNIDMAARSVDIHELKRREPNWSVSPLYALPPIPAEQVPILHKGWKLVRTTAEEDKVIEDFQRNFGSNPQSEVKPSC